jgi:Domain of unknown function (DUF3512)
VRKKKKGFKHRLQEDQIPQVNPMLSAAYESTFASLSSEEADLVSNTYGDDVGVQVSVL